MHKSLDLLKITHESASVLREQGSDTVKGTKQSGREGRSDVRWKRERVITREAGITELIRVPLHTFSEPFQTQVTQRVGRYVFLDLFDRVGGGDQF